MECSWAVEKSLDSLWFFSNTLSRARPSFSAAVAEETEEKEGGEPIKKNQAHEPADEAARAEPVAEAREDPLPNCPRCGNPDAEVAELAVGMGTPASAEEEGKLEERRARRSERRRRRRRRVLGELDLGCDGKDSSVFEENRFLGNHCGVFGAARGTQAVKKMPPLSDGTAMREHLRSWAVAVAVACAVK